jgi:putative endonuclease
MTGSRRGRERAGRYAEGLAAWLLRLKGYRILARRYATPLGELDLVARRAELLIFVEVKRRPQRDAAVEALRPRQQERIARAAALYLQQRPALAGCSVRFDIIALAPWRLPWHVEDVWRAQRGY